MQKWEYYLANTNYDDIKYLSALGQQGWELIMIKPNGTYNYYYFKRPIKE